LVPDLAESWTVSPDGKVYTFKLKKDVKWHDDVPFSAQDVAFTLTAIQNPDSRSPLSSSWQGVTVDVVDEHTVNFKLAKPYTPFINATTVGVLPRHMLEGIDPRTMRVAEFNQEPVGTGPYKFKTLDTQNGELVLTANKEYYRGDPLIQEITLRSYDNLDEAEQALKRRQVMGVGKVQLDDVDEVSSMGNLKLHEAGMPDQVAVFFNTSKGLTTDKSVRTSLAQATDRRAIVDNQLKGYASVLSDPIVANGLDLAGGAKQASYNLIAAKQGLEAAGWKPGSDGVRTKDGTRLSIEIVTQSQTIYSQVAKEIAEQWKLAGVEVNVKELDATELQQSYIRPRNYSALLYGVNVGADPDVYAYWHSSQGKDPGLNLSVYKSTTADLALESGRTVRDSKTRSAKYKAFNQAWVNDTPAVMLYTPSYVYGVNRNVYGIHIKRLITPSDRFDEVEKWSVRVKPVHINQ
jgi:peptide/nickel transport system substrate-binding protein